VWRRVKRNYMEKKEGQKIKDLGEKERAKQETKRKMDFKIIWKVEKEEHIVKVYGRREE
jgi:hypothetical protein